MKITIHSAKFLPFLAVTALFTPLVSAQTDTNNSPDMVPPPGEKCGGPMEKLSPAEWAQLKAAHDKAIAQDPTLESKIKSARESMQAAREAMHDAILKADPSVAPILEKMAPPKWGGPRRGPMEKKQEGFGNKLNKVFGKGPDNQEGHRMPPGFANLTDAEKAQLKAAHEKAKNDPAVVAAKQAEKNATTPQDRRAARQALRKVMGDAMLKADPSLKPVLEKIQPQGGPDGPGGDFGGAGGALPPPPQ